MSHRKIATVSISIDLIFAALGFPPDTHVFDASVSPSRDTVKFMVSHPDLPEVPDMCRAPNVTPNVTVNEDARPNGSWITFSWEGAVFTYPEPIDDIVKALSRQAYKPIDEA